MSKMNLRRQLRVSYYEPEEPDWDEHVFCAKCGDYVYEYCSIHGPLLVIPDDKVPAKSPYPPYVPRAALTIPHVFLHIAPSIIPGAGLGIFSTLTLPPGVRFGPYKGTKTTEINSMYCWQVYDRDHKPSHVIDAKDPNRSNWMRYVNCARHYTEQNLLAYQYRGQIYYRTIKVIPRFTELMVFYGSEFAYLMGIDLVLYNSLPEYSKGTVVKKGKIVQTLTELKIETVNNKISKTIPENGYTTSKSTSETCKNIKTNFIENDKEKETLPESNVISDKICDRDDEKVAELTSFKSSYNDEKKNNINLDNNEKEERKVFSCHICEYKCAKKSYLKLHSRIHSGEKPYTCIHCDYKCTQNSNLKNHIKYKHTKEKNFSCHICEYKCVTKGALKLHSRIHSGEKPYTCIHCDYKCTQNSNLKNHIKFKHTKEKNFSCHICEYKCVTKGELKTHSQRIHSRGGN